MLADCEVSGFPLRKRDNVVLLLGAANRDPEVVRESRTGSTSGATPGPTSRSGAGSTIASALRWRVWKAESSSRCCSTGSGRCVCSAIASGFAGAWCYEASGPCRSAASGPEAWTPCDGGPVAPCFGAGSGRPGGCAGDIRCKPGHDPDWW